MITTETIDAYIDELSEGELIDVVVNITKEFNKATTRVLKAVVEGTTQFLVLTNRGAFRKTDVYFWNNGGYRR